MTTVLALAAGRDRRRRGGPLDLVALRASRCWPPSPRWPSRARPPLPHHRRGSSPGACVGGATLGLRHGRARSWRRRHRRIERVARVRRSRRLPRRGSPQRHGASAASTFPSTTARSTSAGSTSSAPGSTAPASAGRSAPGLATYIKTAAVYLDDRPGRPDRQPRGPRRLVGVALRAGARPRRLPRAAHHERGLARRVPPALSERPNPSCTCRDRRDATAAAALRLCVVVAMARGCCRRRRCRSTRTCHGHGL